MQCSTTCRSRRRGSARARTETTMASTTPTTIVRLAPMAIRRTPTGTVRAMRVTQHRTTRACVGIATVMVAKTAALHVTVREYPGAVPWLPAPELPVVQGDVAGRDAPDRTHKTMRASTTTTGFP